MLGDITPLSGSARDVSDNVNFASKNPTRNENVDQEMMESEEESEHEFMESSEGNDINDDFLKEIDDT